MNTVEIEKHAESLVSMYRSGAFDLDQIPGFIFIGNGCTRRAYRRGDYVYKIMYYYHDADAYAIDDSGEDNASEFYRSIQLLEEFKIPTRWVVPTVHLVEAKGHPVSVMNYVEGIPLDRMDEDFYYECEEFNDSIGMADIYYQNVKFHNGKLYMIDLGE